MTGLCAERSSRIAAVEVAIGGIRAIRARVLPQDFRCNAEREMFMQRQNVMLMRRASSRQGAPLVGDEGSPPAVRLSRFGMSRDTAALYVASDPLDLDYLSNSTNRTDASEA
jgi:hypothetical protein